MRIRDQRAQVIWLGESNTCNFGVRWLTDVASRQNTQTLSTGAAKGSGSVVLREINKDVSKPANQQRPFGLSFCRAQAVAVPATTPFQKSHVSLGEKVCVPLSFVAPSCGAAM